MAASLHLEPPLTPRGVLFRHPAMIWVVIGLSLLVAGAAAIDRGSLLLTWDEPIQRWVESNRTAGRESVFRGFSRMGSYVVVFGASAVIVAATATRCRALALTVAVAVSARPLVEFTVKELVGRERPNLDRLITATGHSHPSGHVLAAVTLWGLLPPLVALVTDRRWIWWVSIAVSGVLIVGVSASRVYLGVHWFSDIVQALLLGWLHLTVIETLYARVHSRRGCDGRALAHAAPHTPGRGK